MVQLSSLSEASSNVLLESANIGHLQHKAAERAHRVPIAGMQTVLINAFEKPVTTASTDVHAGLASPETADVVVVGTGLLGLTVARDLVL